MESSNEGATAGTDAKAVAGPPPGRHMLITKAEMLRKVGQAWPTVWSWIAAGEFPEPVRPNAASIAVMWVLAEIDQWIEEKMATARKAYPSGDSNVGNAKHAKKKRRHKERVATKPALSR